MVDNPTAGDFLRSAWAWFKRNYGNIMLTLIFLALLYIYGQLNAQWGFLFNIDNNIQQIMRYGIEHGADADALIWE